MKRTAPVYVCFLLSLFIGTGCRKAHDTYRPGKYAMEISQKTYGTLPDGRHVILFHLMNANGMQADIINYGGILVSLKTPNRKGHLGDVVLGFDDLESYLHDPPYFGALIGRYGNRIARGRFTLEGKEYSLAVNNNGHHLHGGLKGFDKQLWNAEPIQTDNAVGVKLSLLSPHGDEGYPGNLDCHVTYLLTNEDELRIVYRALTDRPTVVNLTHHSYFNLTECQRDILDHELTIGADRYTPVDEGLIPLGTLESVSGTPLDFRESTPIGSRIDNDDIQLLRGRGYDHNFVLNNRDGSPAQAALVYEPQTGRTMEVLTSEPGLQFYSGNFLDGTLTGKNGIVYGHRWGFCLEAQHFPDSPNQPAFPSVVLHPGEKYAQTTVYRFSVMK
ncbi:MAG TPA: galactose mutarotase [bacterium]|nr:galactose mutarotase [bacterium]